MRLCRARQQCDCLALHLPGTGALLRRPMTLVGSGCWRFELNAQTDSTSRLTHGGSAARHEIHNGTFRRVRRNSAEVAMDGRREREEERREWCATFMILD